MCPPAKPIRKALQNCVDTDIRHTHTPNVPGDRFATRVNQQSYASTREHTTSLAIASKSKRAKTFDENASRVMLNESHSCTNCCCRRCCWLFIAHTNTHTQTHARTPIASLETKHKTLRACTLTYKRNSASNTN